MIPRSIVQLSLPLALLLTLAGCPGDKATPGAGAEVVGNAVCPVSGKPVGGAPSAPSFYSDHQGRRIGFMCPSCKGKFDSASEQEKTRLLKKAMESVKPTSSSGS